MYFVSNWLQTLESKQIPYITSIVLMWCTEKVNYILGFPSPYRTDWEGFLKHSWCVSFSSSIISTWSTLVCDDKWVFLLSCGVMPPLVFVMRMSIDSTEWREH